MKTKICNTCNVERPLTEFYQSSAWGRYRSDCKMCYKKKKKEKRL